MAKSSVSKTDFKNLASNTTTSKRIESPIAKYNSIGQLSCVICNQIIKSELVWSAHLNSKQHLQNKQKLKSQILTSSQPETKNVSIESTNDKNFKRPFPVSIEPSNQEKSNENESLKIKKQKLDNSIKKTDSVDLDKQKVSEMENANKNSIKDQETKSIVQESSVATNLPEGFFDDPDMDDKVRGVSREANLEAEYEEFKKIIQIEEKKSDLIVEQDDQLSDFTRNIEQVDDLINRWSRIESLHQKREALLAAKTRKETMDHDHLNDDQFKNDKTKNTDENSDDEDLENLDKILCLDFHSKSIF